MVGLVDMGNEASTCAELPSDRGFYSINEGLDVATLTKFLERPTIVTGGNVGAAPGGIWAYAFANTSNYRTILGANNWDRLKGAVGVRGTMVFTVTVTSSAFNQGILALAYQHGISSLTSNKARHLNFPNVVNLPHVRMNLASTTMMQLEVPYISQVEYIPIETSSWSPLEGGVVSLTNLTGSRVVAGQDAPRYTVYASMKDIEVIGPIPYDTNTVSLQAGIDQTKHTIAKAVKSAGVVVKGVSQITKEAKESKLVSGTLDTVSKVARVASYVPGLGAIGGTVDWFASFASKTAKSLGYSKPLDEKLIKRMTRQSYGLDGQIDVPGNGFSLSPFQGNKVNVGPDLGMSDHDEMHFDYILTKYQYIYHGVFTNSAAIGDAIYGCPICPTSFWYRDAVLGAGGPLSNKPLKTGNTATENAFLPSTLCYVSDSFRWWRGAFKFRISFAKTKLHGGRLQMTFIPNQNVNSLNFPHASTTVVPAIGGGAGPVATGYSYVFDLRDADEFEFEVPYISFQPYTSVIRSIGDVSLTVVAPLKANATVPTTVDYMVEVAAMPGFELACPAPSMMTTVPTAGATTITYQSGLSLAPAIDDISQQVIGERMTSLKQAIMQPDYFVQDIANLTIFDMHFDPWYKANAPALTAPMSTTAVALWMASRSSRFASLYAFARGSTMAIVQKDVSADNVATVIKYKGNSGGANPTTFSSFFDRGLNYYSSTVIADTLESVRAKIPIYGPYARYNVQEATRDLGGDSVAPNTNVWSNSGANVVPQLTVRNSSGNTARILVGRAAADDATLSRFIGPPACIVFNTLATVSPVYGSAPISTF